MGVNWKSEEREELEEAAALRSREGSGETERKEGNAAVRELGEAVIASGCLRDYRLCRLQDILFVNWGRRLTVETIAENTFNFQVRLEVKDSLE